MRRAKTCGTAGPHQKCSICAKGRGTAVIADFRQTSRRREMDNLSQTDIPRGKIGIRLIFTLLFLVILSIMHFVIQVLALIQYVILLITRSYSEPLRSFSNKAAAYVYRLIRYITLNDNTRPFPFTDFPAEIESPEDPAKFD
jgi:hypothetical protein